MIICLRKGEDFGMVGAERVWGNLFSMHIYMCQVGLVKVVGDKAGEEVGDRR